MKYLVVALLGLGSSCAFGMNNGTNNDEKSRFYCYETLDEQDSPKTTLTDEDKELIAQAQEYMAQRIEEFTREGYYDPSHPNYVYKKPQKTIQK